MDLRGIFEKNLPNPGHCLLLRPMNADSDRVWASIGQAFAKTFNWIDVAGLNGQGEIMEEVLVAIARADAVIVDVTGDNPNVFYELGIARMAKGERKIVIVKQARAATPFDIRGDRYLEYEPGATEAILPALEARIWNAMESTTWFRLAEGEAHRVGPLAGQDTDYEFSVRTLSFAGRDLGTAAVRIEVAIRPYPVTAEASPEIMRSRLSKNETCDIPHLPWRLKFERFEEEDGITKAVICVIPAAANRQFA